MTARPKMHARNSSGRKVSLLNDEPGLEEQDVPAPLASAYSPYDPAMLRSYSATSAQSRTSSPLVPELIRADSFDSSNTNDPLSPITPTSRDFGRPASYGGAKGGPAHFDYRESLPRIEDYHPARFYPVPAPSGYAPRAAAYPEPQMYEEDGYPKPSPQERGPKRYPCRHRETHNCDKTFTTSGHASRHSKIHTAEKGVVCTWPGCQKKFTRGDNMKQHLETHTKDRSRAAAAHKPATAAAAASTARTLTMPAGVRKPGSIDGRASRPSSRNTHSSSSSMEYPVDPALYRPPPGPAPYGSSATPASAGA
ncbi:C2H2 transcription factor [Diplocarpon rosae]|nr:C2H2 transcription factor [Diplocarpon rosae]